MVDPQFRPQPFDTHGLFYKVALRESAFERAANKHVIGRLEHHQFSHSSI